MWFSDHKALGFKLYQTIMLYLPTDIPICIYSYMHASIYVYIFVNVFQYIHTYVHAKNIYA